MTPDPWIDRRIGGAFVVRARIASWSVGTLYLAEREIRSRPVALFVLHEELARDPEIVRRFHARASVAARLAHPGIVALLDVGETEAGVPYQLLEHVAGDTMGELVQHGGALGSRRAARLIGQLLDALAAAHELGLAHGHLSRDIVLVAHEGALGDRVKVLGFGMPRLDEVSPTTAGDLLEAASLLYEMLTREPPGSAPLEPPSRAPRSSSTSTALDAVVLRALAARPEDRYPTARAFHDAIDDAIARTTLPEPRPALPRAAAYTDEGDQRALGRVALAAGRPSHAAARFREALGDAIVRGDVGEMIDLYLDLAAALVAMRDYTRAAAELREAIDLVTLGEGPRAVPAPPGFDRLLRFLGDVDRKRARR